MKWLMSKTEFRKSAESCGHNIVLYPSNSYTVLHKDILNKIHDVSFMGWH